MAINDVAQLLPPLQAGCLRIFIALGTLSLLIFVQKKQFSLPIRLCKKAWLAGFFSHGLPFALIFWGEKHASAAVGGILNASVPIWTLVIGAWFLRTSEKLNFNKILGILLGLSGVCLIFLPRLTHENKTSELLGVLAITGMAISYAIGTLLNKRIFSAYKNIDQFSYLFQQFFASAVVLLILSLSIEGQPDLETVLRPRVLVSLLYLGICSSTLAFLIYNHLIRKWGAVPASSVTYLIPVSTLILSFLILNKPPDVIEVSGAALILSGIALTRKS